MEKSTRRKHTAGFKAKMAIEALREQSTLSELLSKYKLSQTQISRWKSEFMKNETTAGTTSGYSTSGFQSRQSMSTSTRRTRASPEAGH